MHAPVRQVDEHHCGYSFRFLFSFLLASLYFILPHRSKTLFLLHGLPRASVLLSCAFIRKLPIYPAFSHLHFFFSSDWYCRLVGFLALVLPQCSTHLVSFFFPSSYLLDLLLVFYRKSFSTTSTRVYYEFTLAHTVNFVKCDRRQSTGSCATRAISHTRPHVCSTRVNERELQHTRHVETGKRLCWRIFRTRQNGTPTAHFYPCACNSSGGSL